MPSRIWYGAALLCLTAGIGGAVLFLLPRVAEIEGSLARVVVPGSAELRLAVAGHYTIFHEARSSIDGTIYRADDIAGLTVAVLRLEGQRQVALAAPGANTSYDFGGHAGVSIFSFEVAAPGMYRLTARYADDRSEPRTVLAVGRDFFGALMLAIFGTVGIGLAGVGAAVSVFVVTLLKRRAAMRAGARAG